MKPVFDPLFAPQDLPDLALFYPDEGWFSEQKMMRSVASTKNKLNVKNFFSGREIMQMLFWDCRPGKMITLSFLTIIISFICLLSFEKNGAFGAFILGFIVFLIACAYNADNFLSLTNYWYRSQQNKKKLSALLTKYSRYNEFIDEFEQFRTYQRFHKQNKFVNYATAICWLLLLAGLLSLLIFILINKE